MFIVLLNSSVLSILDYCLPVWGDQCQTNCDYLGRLITRAIRNYVYKKSGCDNDMLEAANVLAFKERVIYVSCRFTFIHLRNPLRIPSMSQLFLVNNNGRTRAGTNNSLRRALIPKSEALLRSAAYRISQYWNSIPTELRSCSKILNFEAGLCNYLVGKRT